MKAVKRGGVRRELCIFEDCAVTKLLVAVLCAAVGGSAFQLQATFTPLVRIKSTQNRGQLLQTRPSTVVRAHARPNALAHIRYKCTLIVVPYGVTAPLYASLYFWAPPPYV